MARSRVIDLANFQQFTAINVLSDPGHIGGPIIIPGAMQVVVNWTIEDGKTAHNVCYGNAGSSLAPTPALADQILTALTTGANWTGLAAQLATTTRLSGITLRDVRIANQPLVSSTGAGAPGTAAGAALPLETAAVMTLRTALAGPQNRGRVYIPGWATQALGAGNIINAAAVSALSAWAGTFGAAFGAAGMPLSIGHPARAAYTGSTGTQHPARQAGLVPVTAVVVRDNHWDSQRRRGLK